MKLSKSYFFTLREDVKDEDSKSGNLLVRSGMIKKVSSGIYMFLPLGLRVLDKIRYIVKDEMDKQKLLPGIDEVIKETNLEEGKIIVHLIEGL